MLAGRPDAFRANSQRWARLGASAAKVGRIKDVLDAKAP
jgi:hypothetical protein